MKRLYSAVSRITIAGMLCLAVASCDNIADPDMAQRDSVAHAVVDAAREGDIQELIGLSANDMEAREDAAEILASQAESLKGDVTVTWSVRQSPDHQEAAVTDDDGDTISFRLSWLQAKWYLILGKAGPPKSPAASKVPS